MSFSPYSARTSYHFIVLISAIFFAGYFLLKCPLAFILYKQHIPLLNAYSISTTANVLMAVISVFLGFFLKDCTQQKLFLFLGVLLSSMALILLKVSNNWLILFGISCYVLGGSLYFFNIIIYINKLFSEAKGRQLGNYRYQIWINLGGLVGGFLFILEYNDATKLSEYSLLACFLALIIFIFNYRKIQDDDLDKTFIFPLTVKLIFLFVFIFFCLYYDFATRWIALMAFIGATAYALYYAKRTDNQNYFALILLVLFFSVPYWLGYTILYNEFFHLLDKNSVLFFGMASNSIILIDPLANVVFGFLVLKLYQKFSYTMQADLTTGMLLLATSFLVLSLGIIFTKQPQNLSPLYPIFTILLFSCGEFLIQSTLNASVRNLLVAKENISFAMGILRSSRACASALGYFFMWLTVREGLVQNKILWQKESNLYLLTSIYIFVSLIIYLYVRKSCRRS